MKRDIVLMDIDHTLADSYWRDHLIGEQGWDAYHERSIDDKAIDEVVGLVNSLASSGMEIICVTGRPERWRMVTLRWLIIKNVAMHELLMRPEGDFKPTQEVKIELVKKHLKERFPLQVAFVIDNDERIIEQFKAQGVTAMHIHTRRTS